VRTGISFDEVKSRLAALQAKIDQHQRAVDDVARDYGDNTAVRDYVAEWSLYKKKVAGLAEDANAWTSVTSTSAVQNAEIEFGIFLTKFATLSAKLTAAKSAEKVKALETVLANTPAAREAYKKEAQVSLRTDATPVATPPKQDGLLPSWVVPATGFAGLLFLLKKIFLG
jgi:hypothetical protein